MSTHKDTAIETTECEAKVEMELGQLAAADRDYWRSLASQHGQELKRLETLLTDAKEENAALKEELQAHKAALEKAGNVITVYSTFVRGLHTV